MIYTVTFNPSLDYIVSLDKFQSGKINRTEGEQLLPGGKGLNVSSVLWNLGFPSTAIGFTAGFTGEELQRQMKSLGFHCDFIHVPEGFSRINVKLKNFDGTEINGKGPIVKEADLNLLLSKLDSLKVGDLLVLAGSIPEGITASIYRDIMERLSGRGILFIVDATRELLWNTLPCHPFLIKPNLHELEELFNTEMTDNDTILSYGMQLQRRGARNVLISLGKDGAVLLTETGKSFQLAAPTGRLINSVGAGDSMVAGFIAGWEETHDYEHAFKMGIAAGSASAFSELLATRDQTEEIYQQLA